MEHNPNPPVETAPATAAPEPVSNRRTTFSWALYDVGNSAFYLIIVTAVFPLVFQEFHVQGRGAAGGPNEQAVRMEAGARLAFAAGFAMALVAVLGPILGALADHGGRRKRYLGIFAGIGVAASAGLFFIDPTRLWLGIACYVLGTIGVAGSIVFYDALLPTLVPSKELDRVSSLGFALGYGGSVVLLIVNLLWILHPEWFGLADRMSGMRFSFLTVAVWWALFTVPLLRHVPEAPGSAPAGSSDNALVAGFRQLGHTFRDLLGRRDLLLFLGAFWIYSDGIGTIIKLASAFGDQLKIPAPHILLALVLCQVIAIPFALAFGRLASRFGAKAMILCGLVIYIGICLFGYFTRSAWQFYVLAGLVATAQGGTQALSRSLFASMIPRNRSAEYFGFFSTMEKFAGIIGPILLGRLWMNGGDPRTGILALASFFVIGGFIFLKVDVDAGRRAAGNTD